MAEDFHLNYTVILDFVIGRRSIMIERNSLVHLYWFKKNIFYRVFVLYYPWKIFE